jgi:hypothetical protein
MPAPELLGGTAGEEFSRRYSHILATNFSVRFIKITKLMMLLRALTFASTLTAVVSPQYDRTVLSGIVSQKIFKIISNPPSRVTRPLHRGLAGQECCLNTLILHGGLGGAPLGLPPPLGERGGHPRNFYASSKNARDFYKAEFFEFSVPDLSTVEFLWRGLQHSSSLINKLPFYVIAEYYDFPFEISVPI